MGGGTADLVHQNFGHRGLSPRGRGNLCLGSLIGLPSGSIPAWAGEPLDDDGGRVVSGVYPRVGGGTGPRFACPVIGPGLSPRGRGNPVPGGRRRKPERSIPAWAGEPLNPSEISVAQGVYPRVGGGTGDIVKVGSALYGLSPRGRGNHPRRNHITGRERSIPAWAGEPSISVYRQHTTTVYPRVGGGTVTWRRRIRRV